MFFAFCLQINLSRNMTIIVKLYEYNLADVRDIFNPSTFHPPGIMVFWIKSKIPHLTIVAFESEYQFGRTGILTERDPVSRLIFKILSF